MVVTTRADTKDPKVKKLNEENKELRRLVEALKKELSKTKRDLKKASAPAGGISKRKGGSKASSSPSNPKDASLVKRKGRLVGNRRIVIPQRVLEGPAINQFPNVDSARSRGLWNKGRLCYRNATLQALLHTPAFYRYLGKTHKDCALATNACVVCALQDLAHTYWNRDNDMWRYPGKRSGPLVALNTFNAACMANLPIGTFGFGDYGITDFREEFEKEEQSDAWEFLRYLMKHVRSTSSEEDDAQYDDMFDHSLETSWTCKGCGNQSKSSSDNYDIDLDIVEPAKGLPLTQYLARFFNEDLEIRCERNGADCNRFDKTRANPKQDQPIRTIERRLKNPPEVLMIRLKRFIAVAYPDDPDVHDATGVKLENHIAYDEILDLSNYTADGKPVRYRLDGVVAHSGRTISGGHYINGLRRYDGQSFIVANDDVHVGTGLGNGTFAEMRNPQSMGTKARPYVLIYSKM